MILVDTSVWLDHARTPDTFLFKMLEEERVLVHPFVIGELAMGTLSQRDKTLEYLQELPQAITAYHGEVLDFVANNHLFGTGIGYIDAHLLVALKLTENAKLWTRDKRLLTVAERLRLAWLEPRPS